MIRHHRLPSRGLLLFAVFWVTLCPAGEPGANRRSATLAEFRVGREGRMVLLPVRIRGQAFHFLVDTGASRSGVDVRLRPLLGKSIGTVNLDSFDRVLTVPLYACPDATVGPLDLAVDAVFCLDLAPFRRATGLPIDGVLGMDFLRGHVLEFDFDAGTLRFLDRYGPPHSKTASVRLRFSAAGCPVVMGNVGGEFRELFLVDTGANRSSLRAAVFEPLQQAGIFERDRSYALCGRLYRGLAM